MLAHGEGSQYRIVRRDADPVASYAGGSGDAPASAIGPDTGWHHILAISEGGVSTRIWVDGGLVETGAVPTIDDNGNSSPADPDLFIGANPQTGANNREWWGEIDDVAQWDRVLDESEIATIYQSGVAGQPLGAFIPEPSSAARCCSGAGPGHAASPARVRHFYALKKNPRPAGRKWPQPDEGVLRRPSGTPCDVWRQDEWWEAVCKVPNGNHWSVRRRQ